jgi:hypothetical protein
VSGQASHSRVRALRRWREQAARAIVVAMIPLAGGQAARATVSELTTKRILNGGGFDVARVRQHCGRVIALGSDPDVFADLAEARGRNLAADWLRRNAARLRGRARTAQRLLDTLDGRCPWAPSAAAQPSECRRCRGDGRKHEACLQDRPTPLVRGKCPDCHGTGHNLAGVLPPVEWSPAVRRKVADGYARPLDAPDQSWDERLADELSESRPGFAGLATRVVPRGEHHDESEVGERGWAPPSTVSDRWYSGDEMVEPRGSLVPRWRRGELKHAEQRRVRQANAAMGEWLVRHDVPRVTPPRAVQLLGWDDSGTVEP